MLLPHSHWCVLFRISLVHMCAGIRLPLCAVCCVRSLHFFFWSDLRWRVIKFATNTNLLTHINSNRVSIKSKFSNRKLFKWKFSACFWGRSRKVSFLFKIKLFEVNLLLQTLKTEKLVFELALGWYITCDIHAQKSSHSALRGERYAISPGNYVTHPSSVFNSINHRSNHAKHLPLPIL